MFSRLWSRLWRAIGRAGIYLVDDVRLYVHFSWFIGVVIVFAGLYTVLTPIGHGIGSNRAPLPDASFLTGLYFSVVTISSLGYSYMHPMGVSKALASVQVLLGLAAVGIMIAKVTSRRLSHHVSRLFSSDAQAKLDSVVQKFDSTRSSLSAVMSALGEAYPSVPGATLGTTDGRGAAVAEFRARTSDLRSHCVALHDYLSAEVGHGRYFDVVPRTAVIRLGESLDGAFWVLGQLITSLTAQARAEVLNSGNRRKIAEALDLQQRVCSLVADSATDDEVLRLFASIRETCEQLPASYFAVPEERQPDQVVQGSNEPQGIVGASD